MANKETLMIVEDNHELRNGLKEMLSFEGYTILVAANGKEALEQMNAISPDLILSDISMPVMDGYEFFTQVRARPEGIAIPFIFLTARGDREEIMRGKNLGAEDYLVKPLTRAELVAAVQARLTRFRQLQLAQLEQAYQGSLTVLANAIESRDEYTYGHVDRVTAYSIILATHSGWQGKRLEQLRFGAILHDIGKIFIHEAILKKASPLTPEERAEIRQHTILGAELLKDIPYLVPAIPAVRYHHEQWDGLGYPDGLAGESIPLDARVVAIADSFDAITTTRSYHSASSLDDAYAEILRGSGTIYDPMLVNTFQKVWQTGQIQRIAQRADRR